ncbi:MAG: DJ-1 family glyoxalase III [Acutalibacteraceae bacterium]|nr:DJ-1 family glyoxalase III [Acutalibacteraceae bacterium]
MVYVFLADGFEEMEAVAPIDILRRMEIPVTTVGVTGKTVTGSHGISITADKQIGECDFDDIEAVVLPGGMPGTTNLGENKQLCSLIKNCCEKGILISALCAAPSVLGKLDVLNGREFTCYPSFEQGIDGVYKNQPVVVSEGCPTVITAWGPGAAYRFGFTLAEKLTGRSTHKLEDSMMMCGD